MLWFWGPIALVFLFCLTLFGLVWSSYLVNVCGWIMRWFCIVCCLSDWFGCFVCGFDCCLPTDCLVLYWFDCYLVISLFVILALFKLVGWVIDYAVCFVYRIICLVVNWVLNWLCLCLFVCLFRFLDLVLTCGL